MAKKTDTNDKRVSGILEVIMSYARLEFSVKNRISRKSDTLDAIASGVNMLGEELKSSTISVKEKDQLLREIHHRVKNNMQIISSLLKLQSENEKDKKFLALINDSRNRINAMAFVHELLYATSDFKYTIFKTYVKKLAENLGRSYSESSADVQFNISIDNTVRFDIDKMIPLGLILNEIITNSLKYAFKKGQRSKMICIELIKKEENTYRLTIADNGIGLPTNFNRKKHSNLGMQLIFLLADQIDGKVKLSHKKGTVYKLNF